MKSLLVLTFCIIIIGAIELNGQSSKDILFAHKWNNLLGNSFQFSKDSIVFDTTTFYISNTWKSSIITDSSFLCLYNKGFRPHHSDHDTSFYFEYTANHDSIVLNFLPSWSHWDEYGANFYCAFPDTRFCDLVNKYLVFYSESYLRRTRLKFNFISLQTEPSYHIYYKLFADGSFIFSTKSTPFTSQNLLEQRLNSVTFRTFNGVYSGKLKAETMDSLRTALEDFQGLKGYLYHAFPRLEKQSAHNYLIVKGEHLTIPMWDYPVGRNILSNILHNPQEMSFMGLTGDQEPKPIVLVENPDIFTPKPMWGRTFQKGLYALTGNVSNAETLSTKDTTLYFYQMTVDSFPMRIDETIRTGQSAPFVSPYQLSTEKIGVLYEKKVGYYRTFFGKVKQVKFNLITDTINFQHSNVYEYVGDIERYINRDMVTNEMKDKNHTRINSKIEKAINAFNRRSKRQNK